MAGIRVESNLEVLGANAARAERAVRLELGRLVQGIALDVEAEAKRQAPVFQGHLRRSITTGAVQVSGNTASIEVGPGVSYGRFVEYGRGPGKAPPLSAIAPWAARKGIPAFVLAKAIARRGTRARPYMRPGLEFARSRAPRHINRAVKGIQLAIGGGR